MSQVYLIDQTTFAGYEDISINVKPGRIKVFVKKAQDLDLKPFLGHALFYDFMQYAYPSGILTASIAGITTADDGTYKNVPLTTVSGDGAGALATIIVISGVADSISITDPGQGYLVADELSASVAPGTTFRVTALDPLSQWAFLPGTPQKYKDLFYGCEYTDRYGHYIEYEGVVPALIYFTFARFIEADAIHYTATGPVIKMHDNAEGLKPSDVVKLVQQQRSVANAHANEVEKFLYDKQSDFPLWRYSASNKSARQSGPRIRGIDKTNFNYPGTSNTGNSYLPLNEFLN